MEKRPDMITIACIIGWLFAFSDLLFLSIPDFHRYFAIFFPSYLLIIFIFIDIIFAIAIWCIWQMRIIGIWLYAIALIGLCSMEFIYSVKFFSSAIIAIVFFLIFVYHYNDFKSREDS